MNIITNKIYENLELLPEDLTGWGGTDPIFEQLISEVKPKIIVEVGTWKGQSAITMANAVKRHNLDTTIYCIDTWLGALEFWHWLKETDERDLMLKNGYPQIYYQFLSNVVHNQAQDIIIPFPNTSTCGAAFLKCNKVSADLIYIDASHEEADVYSDICSYYELLNEGGVLFGDDVAWPSVRLAFERFEKERGVKVEIVNERHWVLRL